MEVQRNELLDDPNGDTVSEMNESKHLKTNDISKKLKEEFHMHLT